MPGIPQLLLVATILLMSFTTFGNREDKIRIDLTGNSVQSTDEEQYWTFRYGEPLEYAVLDRKSIGVQKAKRLYTTIYLRTRNKSEDTKKLFAEGTIEIVYMKSRSGSNYFVSHINQLGFKIAALLPNVEKELNELENFWREFRYSVSYDLKEKSVDMIEYPFHTAHYGIYTNRENLLKNYDAVFNSGIKTSVDKSILVPSEKPKGRNFDYTNDEYLQLCDFDSKVMIGESQQYFVVKKINGLFKIIELREKY